MKDSLKDNSSASRPIRPDFLVEPPPPWHPQRRGWSFSPEAIIVTRPHLLYLDYNATTPLDPRVLEAMLPWLREGCANPSSSHAPGRRARAAIDQARGQAAELLGTGPGSIIFTSGGTEANNHAIIGAARLGAATDRCELVISAVEHPAVTEVCRFLEREGCVTRVAGLQEFADFKFGRGVPEYWQAKCCFRHEDIARSRFERGAGGVAAALVVTRNDDPAASDFDAGLRAAKHMTGGQQ